MHKITPFKKWLLKSFVTFTSDFWFFLLSYLYFSLITYEMLSIMQYVDYYIFDGFFIVENNLCFSRPTCIFFIFHCLYFYYF